MIESAMNPSGLDIDRLSFQLGMINCFAEMVAVGVKRLAISPPLSPEDYEAIREVSDSIVEGSGILSYLETSREFMRLLSYPEEAIAGKLRAGGKEDPFMLVGKD
jgi:hypothetical protein